MLCYAALFFVVLVSACGLLSEDERIEMHMSIQPLAEKCMNELGISENELEIMMNSRYKAIDPCMLGCMMKGLGVMDDEGVINDKVLIDFYGKFVKDDDKLNHVKEVGKNCMTVNEEEESDGTKGCQRALLFTECFLKQKEQLDMS